MSNSDIEAKAEKLLRDSGADGVFPVDLESIASYLGYAPMEFQETEELRNVSGLVDHKRKVIYVNSGEALGRKRFTLAHEIAHACLHEGDSPVDYRDTLYSGGNPKETEANLFASALLMPRSAFARQWIYWKGNKDYLVNYFGVSPQAIEIREKTVMRA